MDLSSSETQLFDFAATCLHAGAQGKGKLTQWRFQDVDQSHRHKDFLGIQNILFISQNINSKHRKSNLQTDNSELLSYFIIVQLLVTLTVIHTLIVNIISFVCFNCDLKNAIKIFIESLKVTDYSLFELQV